MMWLVIASLIVIVGVWIDWSKEKTFSSPGSSSSTIKGMEISSKGAWERLLLWLVEVKPMEHSYFGFKIRSKLERLYPMFKSSWLNFGKKNSEKLLIFDRCAHFFDARFNKKFCRSFDPALSWADSSFWTWKLETRKQLRSKKRRVPLRWNRGFARSRQPSWVCLFVRKRWGALLSHLPDSKCYSDEYARDAR